MFRNNVVRAWQGSRVRMLGRGADRRAVIEHPRPVRAGLQRGSADQIGWVSVEITPEMVGRRVAVFLSLELKDPDKGRATAEQRQWAEQVRAAGGAAGIVSTVVEAEAVIRSAGDGVGL